jgi:hypothetical protein
MEETAAVGRLRIQGAADLHAICRSFVNALNSKLVSSAIVLDPAEYSSRNFNDSGANIFQINLRGRLLRIDFTATEELYSTGDFRRCYTLLAPSSSVRGRAASDRVAESPCSAEGLAVMERHDRKTDREAYAADETIRARRSHKDLAEECARRIHRFRASRTDGDRAGFRRDGARPRSLTQIACKQPDSIQKLTYRDAFAPPVAELTRVLYPGQNGRHKIRLNKRWTAARRP